MADFHPQCPKCKKPMDRGHIPDYNYGAITPSGWSPGDPVPRRYIGGIKSNLAEQISLVAFRCPECGLVELYAPPD